MAHPLTPATSMLPSPSTAIGPNPPSGCPAYGPEAITVRKVSSLPVEVRRSIWEPVEIRAARSD